MRRQSGFWHYLKNLVGRKASPRPQLRRWRPCLEAFEDRLVPTALSNVNAGVIAGQVFLDAHGSNSFGTGDFVLPGVQITLTGSSTNGQTFDLSTTTDANGNYFFSQVPAGTYQLTSSSTNIAVSNPAVPGGLGGIASGQTISAITLGPGQVALNNNFTVRGIASGGISLAQFLTTSVVNPFGNQTAGSGETFADGMAQFSGALPGGSGTVGGTITNSTTGAGIGGVQVALTGLDIFGDSIFTTTKTAANGTYQFANVNGGNYTLSVPQQPAGFRAGLASGGSLGGISPRNNEIRGIVVGSTTVTANNYNFSEIPMPAATSGPGPALSAALTDDTGSSATDGITSDDTIQGTVSSTPTSFLASLDNHAAISVINQIGPGGNFILNAGLLNQIAGGTVSAGSHTLHLTATNAQGSSSVNVSFTLVTAAPAQPTAGFTASERLSGFSAPNVDVTKATTAGTYTIAGTAAPGATVAVLGLGQTLITTADASGNYSFASVPLIPGGNEITVVAMDNASGNMSVPLSELLVVDSAPVFNTAIPTQNVSPGNTATVPLFQDLSYAAANTTMTINTNHGPLDVELFNSVAPNTVSNWLNLANTKVPTFPNSTYNDSFFTRLVNNFVLQGGGLVYNPATNTFTGNSATAIPSEHTFTGAKTNVIGTIAMALSSNSNGTTDPNTGTVEYFINLANNSSLDQQGFTVFGRIGDPESMRLINTLATFPTQNQSSFGNNHSLATDLSNLPLNNYNGTFPAGLTTNNLQFIQSVTPNLLSPALTFTVSNTNPTAAIVTIDSNHQLSIQGEAAGSTTATITITDSLGLSVTKQVLITVS